MTQIDSNGMLVLEACAALFAFDGASKVWLFAGVGRPKLAVAYALKAVAASAGLVGLLVGGRPGLSVGFLALVIAAMLGLVLGFWGRKHQAGALDRILERHFGGARQRGTDPEQERDSAE